MIIRIITQADDVIVHPACIHLVVEIGQHIDARHALGVQDDFGARTLLAARPDGCLEQVGKPHPILLGAGGETLFKLGLWRAHGSPKHTVADLVARLDIIGGSTGCLEFTQAVTGVFIDLDHQLFVIEPCPLCGRVLHSRIGPGITVVEVKHELHAGSLDAPSQHLDGVQILNHALTLMLAGSVGGIDEQAHTLGIPTLLLGPRDDIVDDLTVDIIIMGPGNAITQCHELVGLILGQHRDVATHDRPVVWFHLAAAQDDVNQHIHIGDVHLAVSVHIKLHFGIGTQDGVDDRIDVGNIDLTVIVHIAGCSRCNSGGQHQHGY